MLHHLIDGQGDTTVVLIHGWCCDAAFWRAQRPALAPRVRTLALDLPGHGGSPPEAAALRSIAAMAAAVVDTLEALPPGPLVLVGHSMGGPVAAEAAIRLGARCRLVVGVDSFIDPKVFARLAPAERAQRLRPFEADFGAAMTKLVGRLVRRDPDGALVRWITGRMAGFDPAIGLPAFAALLDWDAAARLPLVPCPVETINAAAFSPPDETGVPPGLVLHRMAGVGHFPMQEDPAAFNALLLSILDRHRAGGAP